MLLMSQPQWHCWYAEAGILMYISVLMIYRQKQAEKQQSTLGDGQFEVPFPIEAPISREFSVETCKNSTKNASNSKVQHKLLPDIQVYCILSESLSLSSNFQMFFSSGFQMQTWIVWNWPNLPQNTLSLFHLISKQFSSTSIPMSKSLEFILNS